MKAKPWADTYSSDEASRSPSGDNRKQPKGLIKTLEDNGIVVGAKGGWKCREEHTASQGLDKLPKGRSPESKARQGSECCENEGEPHIRNVLRPSIVHQFLLQAWVGWMQLYVNAKVIEKQSAVERYIEAPSPKAGKAGVGGPTRKARGRPHQSSKG